MSIAPWSFSKIKSFEQCPKKFYHLNIAKDYKEPHTEAMRYGTKMHLVAEEYIKNGKPIPPEFAYLNGPLQALERKKGNKLTEIKMGLDDNLDPCGFRDKNVWWRGIADLIIIKDKKAWVVDYKTSKSAEYADKGQLELMALAIFKYFPFVEDISAGLLFTVKKVFITSKYHVDDSEALWKNWKERHNRMKMAVKSNVWNAHPSGLCYRHCPVVECVYNGANR